MMNKKLMNIAISCVFLTMANITYATDADKNLEAVTASGDQVILKPNGRWEYVDTQKAAEAAKIAKQYPENNVCPPGAQGGWFGTKCILPGDPAFNRKSRIGK